MIVVKLMGGLGNQMFQYSAAKALALKHNVDVKVDVSFLNINSKGNYTQRKFELNIFKSEIKIADEQDLKKYTNRKNNKFSRVLQRKFPKLYNTLYAVESGSNYHPEFKNYPKNTYIQGFRQSEKYFKDYREQIKNEFIFKDKLPAQLEIYFNKIQTTSSVSIHVRRGDYVALKSASDFHGTCSLDYYIAALDIITKKNKNVELFIFSDDINWCKQNFNFQYPINFVEHNLEAHWDMFLMSHCQHNITANSSFSWWGAWLNQNPDKIVIAPKNWFADKTINTSDLIPESWIRL